MIRDCFLQKTCLSNQKNRAKVVFSQKTGSRSYAAHIYQAVRTSLFVCLLGLTNFCTESLHFACLFVWLTFQKLDRNGEDLCAIEMFKATQHSQEKGYSEAARNAIVSHSYYASHVLKLHLFACCYWCIKHLGNAPDIWHEDSHCYILLLQYSPDCLVTMFLSIYLTSVLVSSEKNAI